MRRRFLDWLAHCWLVRVIAEFHLQALDADAQRANGFPSRYEKVTREELEALLKIIGPDLQALAHDPTSHSS